jgi:hypothetical protein
VTPIIKWEDGQNPNLQTDEERKKKKKKRHVGPTIEATTEGLAGPGEGITNTAPGQWTPIAPPTAQPLPQPVGSLFAQGAQALGPQPLTMTPVEAQVRNINLAYFAETGELAPAGVVETFMDNPATQNLTVEQYQLMFQGAKELPVEVWGNPKSDLFHKRMPTLPTEGGNTGVPSDRNAHPVVTALTAGYTDDLTTKEQIQKDLRLVKRTRSPKARTPGELLEQTTPEAEVYALSETLYRRNKPRGRPSEWDRENPWGDPDLLANAAVYAFCPNIALGLWGDDKEKAAANANIEYLRGLGYSDDALNAIGRKLGVGMADWSDQKTLAMVFDAMRSTDNDLVHEVAYDAWQYGRRIGESASQARAEYVAKFGADRLPAAERAAYDASNETIMGIAAKVMEQPGKVFDAIERVPYLGKAAAPIIWAGEQTMKWGFSVPIETAMRSISTVYDMSLQAVPDIYERGYSEAEYVRAMQAGLMDESEDKWKLWEFHWGVFTDTSRWAAAWEESEGHTPLADMARVLSVEQFGYVKPWASDVGALGDLATQFYVGAKMDPLVRGAARAGADAAFLGGRAAERAILSERIAGRLGEQTGAIGSDITQGSAIRARIRELGGISRKNNDFWDPGISTKENRTAFRNLDSPEGGVPIDELAATIAEEFPGSGIVDAQSLMDAIQSKPRQSGMLGEGPRIDRGDPNWTPGDADLDATFGAPRAEPSGYHGTTGSFTEIDPNASRSSIGLFDMTDSPQAARTYAGENGNVYRVLGKPEKPFLLDEAPMKQIWGAVAKKAGLDEAAFADIINNATNKGAMQTAVQRHGVPTDLITGVIEDAGHDAYVFKEAGTWANGPGEHTVTSWTRRAIEEGKVKLEQQAPEGVFEQPGTGQTALVEEGYQTSLGVGDRVTVRSERPEARMGKESGEIIGQETLPTGEVEYVVKTKDGEAWVRQADILERPAPLRDWGKVAEGEPVTIRGYHVEGATGTRVTEYGRGKLGRDTLLGDGFYMARTAEEIAYAGGTPQLYEVTLRRPYVVKGKGEAGTPSVSLDRLDPVALRAQGYDGIVLRNVRFNGRLWNEAVAFEGKPRAIKTDAHGVEVAPVRTAQGAVDVDRAIAPDIQRLNDAGFPTVQSHGGPEGHPQGHPTVTEGIEPYVEFKVTDLSKNQLKQMSEAAKASGAKVTNGKAADGHSTKLVTGDVAAFTDTLLGYNRGGAKPPIADPVQALADARGELYNRIFRNNAEVIAAVDDPAYIAWMYEIPEDNLAALKLTERLAKETSPDAVEPLLQALRDEHGIEIDGGAAALWKNIRQASYRKGFAQRNFLRFFITPTNYGRTHGIEGSTDAVYNYMVAAKLGMAKLTPEGWARIRGLRDELFAEHNALKKRAIVSRIDDEIEANIIAREGSLDGLTHYTRWYHRAQGRAILAGARRAYFGTFEGGRAVEGSRVASKTRATALVEAEVARARAHFEELAADAPAAWRKRAQQALDDAQADAAKVAQAIETIEREATGGKVSAKALKAAQRTLDDYGAPMPVKMGQHANHIVFRHNPRILASYLAGPTSRALALTDQAVFQPLMTVFKETVMASLGFPIRVNIGDEYIRLIPEGTLTRMREAKATMREAREQGLWGDELDAQIRDKLAYDWVASDSGDWILVTKDTHPRYYEYLAADLESWAREPIVQRLVRENGGEFPASVPDIEAFMRKVLAEDSELGRNLKEFLEDTYRYEGGIDEAAFREWAGLWQDRLEAIAAHRTLRQAMTARADVEALRRLDDRYLWPVNAPEQLFIGGNTNPLYQLSRLNPFHYVYNGVPIGGGRRAGSIQVLGAMSNWLRETIFSDRYYLEREAELARAPELAHSRAGLEELHRNAAERAMRHTNRVTYSRSSTMFEDMTRNLIPFGNAYRQFWQYWGATFLKHPVSMSVFLKNAPQARQESVDLLGGAVEGLGGPEVTLNGSFLGIGDYQAYLPAVPFMAFNDEGEGQTGLGSVARSNIPQASFLVTGGARTMMGALGMDPEAWADRIPGFAGLSSRMAPYSRQARLLFAVSGWDATMGGNAQLESLFGDHTRLEKAHVNAIIDQLRWEGGKLKQDQPLGWRIAEALGVKNPEALFAEGWKTFAPLPATASYSPKTAREKGNWLYEYYDALRGGRTQAAANLRSEHAWLDRYLSYYDASEAERVEMKRDPANKDMLKWWVSPYNYDRSGAPLEGGDWQDQFTAGRVTYKSDDELITAINNLYVDIHGGTYMQSEYRTGGTTYKGDASKEAARKRTIAKMRKALGWAKGVANELAKTKGWDKDVLLYQFRNPESNWGIWPTILAAKGLDPAQYNIAAIAHVYFDKYAEDYPTSGSPMEAMRSATAKQGKVKPQYLASTDALRALDLAQYLPTPSLAKRLLTETPFVDDIRQARRQQKDDITKAIIDSAAMDQWYWIGSQQLKTVGIAASPKLDAIQLDLNRDYNALKALKPGTSEYKAARTAYYRKRDKLLRSVKGGEIIAGGVADRLAALPFVLTPDVTTMGTGRHAADQQKAYNVYARVVRGELARDNPDPNRLAAAWGKLVGWRKYSPKQQAELKRVAAWGYLLTTAKALRHDMRTHYSEYYKAPGESAQSKYGQQRVKALEKAAERLKSFSPEFARQVETWFGDRSLGYAFLDWYAY